MEEKQVSRREVIRYGALGTAGAALGAPARRQEKLPTRVLGKTGERVPVLGFGTAPVGVKRSLKDGIAVFHKAIDMGVNYMDTAPSFAGYGQAQVQLGHVLRDRRRDVFVVTKLWEPRMDEALRLLERNLRELQTDQADLVYAHSLGSDRMDPDVVFGKSGTMAALEKARKEGLTRYVGVSGHNRPGRFLRALDAFDIDVMMNAVNMADRYTYGFEREVWPVAAKKQVGLVAMKVFGGIGGGGSAGTHSSSAMPRQYLPLAFRYAFGIPEVTTLVIGMVSGTEVQENVARVRSYRPLSDAERQRAAQIGKRLADRWGPHYGPVA